MPHSTRDGHIRATGFPVIGNEVFDGHFRVVRQMGDECGKAMVQFFGLLRVQFASFGGPSGSFPYRLVANGANCAALPSTDICGWFCETWRGR